ncbi:MAG: hypothetical protein JSR93_09245, partial [Verrucomicrobia bacterium]|nr:hypothetical protein [Verrucomicrobiota bacterium]
MQEALKGLGTRTVPVDAKRQKQQGLSGGSSIYHKCIATKEFLLRKGRLMKPSLAKLRFVGGVFLITGMTIGV